MPGYRHGHFVLRKSGIELACHLDNQRGHLPAALSRPFQYSPPPRDSNQAAARYYGQTSPKASHAAGSAASTKKSLDLQSFFWWYAPTDSA
ncbi:hypothetical protein MFUM_700149 [Methylacidiphilum fumariolicum SolV]|uniref:Uncharacterized protein n=1 Tax=Methylacidiphilum fumariolicum (strain SolV) TaxID=1156937 RepID=I0JZC6_METFB|nr:hypothetical protein MFUM_700149 [Methylacidiphilum fumariolicum SolV]